MDLKQAQKPVDPSEAKRLADEVATAKKEFESYGEKVAALVKEKGDVAKKYGELIPQWMELHHAYHLEMEKILKDAGYSD